MYRYFLFAYSMYYPRGGMNDCIRKFNDSLDLDFHNINLYDQFYAIYDSALDVKHGMSMESLVEEYEDVNGDLDEYQEDEVRIEFLKDLVKKSVRLT